MRVGRFVVILIIGIWLAVFSPNLLARAELKLRDRGDSTEVENSYTKHTDTSTQTAGSDGGGSESTQGGVDGGSNRGAVTTGSGAVPSGPSPYELKVQQWQEKVKAIKAANEKQVAAFRQALTDQNAALSGNLCSAPRSCGSLPEVDLERLPERPEPPDGAANDAGGPQQPYIPEITAEQAAYITIATKLTIPTVQPGIGPEPHDNQWEMAVVGYPYWLWADGPTSLAPVSDSEAGIEVTLSANLRTVVFDMGDGTKINCNGSGTPYTSQVDVKEASPTCGHVYQKMSQGQPGGTYTVTATAYWDVAYTTPIGSGVISVVTASQREVLVGELQTVITG